MQEKNKAKKTHKDKNLDTSLEATNLQYLPILILLPRLFYGNLVLHSTDQKMSVFWLLAKFCLLLLVKEKASPDI